MLLGRRYHLTNVNRWSDYVGQDRDSIHKTTYDNNKVNTLAVQDADDHKVVHDCGHESFGMDDVQVSGGAYFALQRQNFHRN